MDKNNTLEARREFKDPISGNSYYIAVPTADDVRGADWQYNKVYTKALVDGITTSAEMMDILRRRGIVGPEFEQRQRELTNELSEKVEALQKAATVDAKEKLANEVASAREELFTWNQRLNGPMNNTCEQVADDARLEYLTACMVQDREGERVWEDYASFLKETNQSLAMRARFEVMLYLQGLDSDFLEKTPEAQAIREIEEQTQEEARKALEELEKAAEESDKEESKKETPKKTARSSSNKSKSQSTSKKSTSYKKDDKESSE